VKTAKKLHSSGRVWPRALAGFAVGTAIVCLSTGFAQAATMPDAYLYAYASQQVGPQHITQENTGTAPGPVGATSGGASASVVTEPYVSLVANAANNSGSEATMTYYFGMSQETQDVYVTVDIAVRLSTTASLGDLAQASIRVSDNTGAFSNWSIIQSVCSGSNLCSSGSFDAILQYTFHSADAQRLTLDVQTTSHGDNAWAYADPYITIDPNSQTGDAYLVFSSDVANALAPSVGTTPMPATLPLFVSGLGGFAFLARRRQQRESKAA